MESRVHNERCMPGSEGGARKPTGESRQGAERPPYATSTLRPHEVHSVCTNPARSRRSANVLSAKHLDRIAGGLLYAATSEVPWPILLRRTFDVDIATCARCGGHVRVRAVVTDERIAQAILGAIANANARARAPPQPVGLQPTA
jgi:hypothetical protein